MFSHVKTTVSLLSKIDITWSKFLKKLCTTACWVADAPNPRLRSAACLLKHVKFTVERKIIELGTERGAGQRLSCEAHGLLVYKFVSDVCFSRLCNLIYRQKNLLKKVFFGASQNNCQIRRKWPIHINITMKLWALLMCVPCLAMSH